MTRRKILVSLMAVSLGFFFSMNVAKAQVVSKTKMAGKVSVTMRVLPAETYEGAGAEMKWDGGASAVTMNSTPKPNHHLVAFLKEGGKPVENASVMISYRELSPKKSDWTSLPVCRMHVAGKGMDTAHFGNNLWLAKGEYEARITVNKNPSVMFRFDLTK